MLLYLTVIRVVVTVGLLYLFKITLIQYDRLKWYIGFIYRIQHVS